MHEFQHIFISIIIEAFPFILLGVLVSAVLQVFVSDRLIAQLTPRNPIAGVLFGSLLGLLLPLCECGMIPIVRRLIRKGMPAYIGMVFIFAGPIINPIVFVSTFNAFRAEPSIAYARMGLAFAVCILLGMVLYAFMKRNPLKLGLQSFVSQGSRLPDDDNYQYNHGHVNGGIQDRIQATFTHASEELFDIGKYLIIGAFITALAQSALDPSLLHQVSGSPALASLFMMAAGFVLSLCSTSDAFVASSLHGIFGPGALLAFLVFGPMVDVKSLLLLFAAFRSKIVVVIVAFLIAAVWIGSMLTEKLVFGI
ncbi:permease [Paenibacillus rhizovicinus]|uniref:Permease n=1 Tax=Paenibacillus rhizovicinus TaxID=2704463 RepID=A0A6C0NX21_9BACL|nr:permease [Paenibacillus rhizovicinus]QHW30770.1 permease [Paenibacillus rhizovicinus]